ncbi:PREDICTED: tetratricopeptide repeat protein 39C-like [Branchiostoma belcheri]|uniref:Tetratricopeptide repeat protein 39C-like n=1 Tax=Branchiostoma belcheri TaxID=7741 RepID=A0A6P4ZP33_BRABE|nr:PREDICTED: tetratricopeptide repeat protein 39C-like [Branchiostoma belcheri]
MAEGFTKNGMEPIEFDDVRLALAGINLMLNNGFQESDMLFNKYRQYSPLMSAGASFVSTMHAVMTFEEEKIAAAMQMLKSTEHLCTTDEGFLESIKNKLGNKPAPKETVQLTVAERLERQIIVGDCQLYIAMLTFIKQELSAYVKGGWVLRKAWKIYNRVYREVTDLIAYCEWRTGQKVDGSQSSLDSLTDGEQDSAPRHIPSKSQSSYEISREAAKSSVTTSASCENIPSKNKAAWAGVSKSKSVAMAMATSTEDLPSMETLGRLLGAVSFGYGLFQLTISMIPPSLLKIVNMLGFRVERDIGLKCLKTASKSQDMKAPLATLSLLWYHLVATPFFALGSGSAEQGLCEAEKILRENEATYPTSALFLFFKGRLLRLRCQNEESLAVYNQALEACKDQREIQLLCVYEISWSQLLKLNFAEALSGFQRLKEESRWSQCYYAYLSAICYGAQGKITESRDMFKQVPKFAQKKRNPLELYTVRKAQQFLKAGKKNQTREYVMLLALEVLYLWRALPTCDTDDLQKMLQECGKVTDQSLISMGFLIEGSIHSILGNRDEAMTCFEAALAKSSSPHQEQHVAPFACYELGVLYLEKAETHDQGKALLIKAKDGYKDYDFENRLRIRVHAVLRHMKDVPVEQPEPEEYKEVEDED